MEIYPRLLDHPFYQAWMRGDVSWETLAAYHRSYAQLVRRIPFYWQAVVSAFEPNAAFHSPVVQEERDHVHLWERWGKRFSSTGSYPDMSSVLDALDAMTPSQLLGAIQAFEVQQPEVARTKKEGLLAHYGFTNEDLGYFDEHAKEDAHIEYGRSLAQRFADPRDYHEGFERGAQQFFNMLDAFRLD